MKHGALCSIRGMGFGAVVHGFCTRGVSCCAVGAIRVVLCSACETYRFIRVDFVVVSILNNSLCVSLRGIISKERRMIGPVEDKTPLF
jgi:hypothetical protein